MNLSHKVVDTFITFKPFPHGKSIIPTTEVYDPRALPNIILVITLVYHAVELSFGLTLLSIVSTQSTPEDIEHIGRWWHLISGFSAGLVFWGVLTPKILGGVYGVNILRKL